MFDCQMANHLKNAYCHSEFRMKGMNFFKLVKSIVMDEAKFNRLSLTERTDLLWEKGTFVDSLLYNDYCLMLYSINRQFVELYVDLKSQSISWVTLANDFDLMKYLNDIQIEV